MSDWKIVNGDLPFKDDFAVRPTGFDEYPNWIWHKFENELPRKVMFPTRYAIDDAPSSMWKVSNDLPFKSSFAPRFVIDDAPASMWKISNDLPTKSVFAPKHPMGAFEGCTNLARVSIPSTVQSIGPYSFKDTALTEVTLPAECTYYSTSFPPGCTITGGVLIG